MAKKELMKRLEELLEQKGMYRADGVNWNSTKATIQSTIKCLELSDEELDEYMTVFKLKYPNSYKVIVNNGDWKTHSHNRFYVYSSAKAILA